jgi:hypothetical protein
MTTPRRELLTTTTGRRPPSSFPFDQAVPPAAKDVRDVSPCCSSSGHIPAILSTARTPDSFPTQQSAPTTADKPHTAALPRSMSTTVDSLVGELLTSRNPLIRFLPPRRCASPPFPPVPDFRLAGIGRHAPAGSHGLCSPVLAERADRPSGAATHGRAGLTGAVGRAHCYSGIFQLSSEYFKFISKLISNS